MLDNAALQDDFTRTREGYSFLVQTLSESLPIRPKDTPETRYKRLKAAIASVASLCPVTLAEADLAARHIAADRHAKECMRLIGQYDRSDDMRMKARAQSNSMGRQADSALRSLLRLQAERMKRDADAKRAEAAVWAEHRAASAMEAALEEAFPASEPVAAREPAAVVAATPEAAVAEDSAPARRVLSDPEALAEDDKMTRIPFARLAQRRQTSVSETQSQFS